MWSIQGKIKITIFLLDLTSAETEINTQMKFILKKSVSNEFSWN